MTTPQDPPAAGRPRQVTDQQIFDALAEAITEHGPHRWTLPGVASRVGLTGPALGYRFGNKRGLLVAFAAHQPDATAAFFDKAATAAATPLDAILDVLTGNLAMMDTRSKVANNLAMLSLDIADDELAQHAQAQARVIKAKLTDLITAADIVPAGDAETIAEHIYIIWNGAVLAWAIDGQGSLEAWLRQRIEQALPTR